MENRTMWMWHYTVDGRHPAPPFGSIKPVVNNGMFTYIYHINWCRISEPSTVSTVPTYDLEKPTTTLSPLRGKIQIQATHLSAKIEVQVSFDILFVRQWYKQKNNPAKRSMISIDIPWTLTWVFSKKKKSNCPHPGDLVKTLLLQEEFAQQIHTTRYPAFFNFVVPASVSPMKGRRYVGKPRPVATYLAPGMIGMVLWKIWVFPKIRGVSPKMDGENNRKPY